MLVAVAVVAAVAASAKAEERAGWYGRAAAQRCIGFPSRSIGVYLSNCTYVGSEGQAQVFLVLFSRKRWRRALVMAEGCARTRLMGATPLHEPAGCYAMDAQLVKYKHHSC